MKRGDIYRVAKPPGGDPRKHRFFVVVSRDAVVLSNFSSVICASIYTDDQGLSTQVSVGVQEGLRHDSAIYCDALISIPKNRLTGYAGHLSLARIDELDRALAIALDLHASDFTM